MKKSTLALLTTVIPLAPLLCEAVSFGKETITLAATGIKKQWVMRQEQRSPRYTTDWQELPVVKASFC